MKIFQKRFIFFFLLFLINIPFLIAYSQNFVTTLIKFTCDELVYLENINIILTQFFQGHFLGAAYNLYSFGYGSVYWLISAILAIPFWLVGSEQGIIITLRLLSLLLSIFSYFLIFLILRKNFGESIFACLAIILSFLNPIIIDYSNMIHPEMIYVFFIVLSFYFLNKDENAFGKYYYFAIMAFALAISTKSIAGFFALGFLLYLGFNFKKITFSLFTKSLLIGCISLIVPNIFLFCPIIFNRYSRWLVEASSVVVNGLPDSMPKNILLNIYSFSGRYCNVILFSILIFLCIFAVLFIGKKVKQTAVNLYIPLFVIVFYFFFSVFYCYIPYHYGIMLMFFLPFIIFEFFKIFHYPIIAVALAVTLNCQNISSSIMRFVQPYSFSEIDFSPKSITINNSRYNALRLANLHVSAYHKNKASDLAISPDLLDLAFNRNKIYFNKYYW